MVGGGVERVLAKPEGVGRVGTEGARVDRICAGGDSTIPSLPRPLSHHIITPQPHRITPFSVTATVSGYAPASPLSAGYAT